MTDLEFDVLDELYFLQPYSYLLKTMKMDEQEVKSTLKVLLEKGWVKCYKSPSEEMDPDQVDFENCFAKYHYLASKAGLLAHNSNF